MDAFSNLSNSPPTEEDKRKLMDFTANIYGAKGDIPLNKLRYRVFEKAFGPSDSGKPLQKLKGVDASSIPPCEAEIHPKIMRTSFIAKMCGGALKNQLPKIPQHG